MDAVEFFTKLWNESPLVQSKLAEFGARVWAKGWVKALAGWNTRGTPKDWRDAVLVIVTERFPALEKLAKRKIAQTRDVDALEGLMVQLISAPDEATARWLLRAYWSGENVDLDDWSLRFAYLAKAIPAIQKMLAEARAEGRATAKGARKMVITIVEARFPALIEVAQQHIDQLEGAEKLTQLIIQLATAPDEEAARCALSAEPSEENADKG